MTENRYSGQLLSPEEQELAREALRNGNSLVAESMKARKLEVHPRIREWLDQRAAVSG